MNTKHYVFMRDIVVRYHPDFACSRYLRGLGLRKPLLFNIERLVEESLAAQGGYNFVDEPGRDFDDAENSDSKTVSVVSNSNYRPSYSFSIHNVDTKIGSLRVSVFNPWKDGVDYMYIPRVAVTQLQENDGTRGTATVTKRRIRTTWSQSLDHYNRLDSYRVPNFPTLAQCQSVPTVRWNI